MCRYMVQPNRDPVSPPNPGSLVGNLTVMPPGRNYLKYFLARVHTVKPFICIVKQRFV